MAKSHLPLNWSATTHRPRPIYLNSSDERSPSNPKSEGTPFRNQTVPILKLETTHPQSRLQTPRPAFQLDPEGRPQVRFRRNAFSPLSPSITKTAGLKTPDSRPGPDTSPITPGTVEKGGEGRTETDDIQNATNFAQRIEQKLWKYSGSKNVVKRWLLEIISWSISALCMAGIIGPLIFYENKRIPNWPIGMTLTGYISVLSKVASGALLVPVSEALGQLKWSWFHGSASKKMWDFEIFDNASRGPWGSLLLLMRTRGRSLAALGAAVTLFALLLDPFFQQVIEYPEHWIQEGTGSLPRAMSYAPFSNGKQYKVGRENLEVDPDFISASYHYFYENGTPPITFGKGVRAEIPVSCPNRNCTWPEYETLGICNQCEEASDRLEFKCVYATLDWVQVPDMNSTTTEAIYPNGTSCGWFMKGTDDPILMTGYNVDQNTPHSGEILITRSQPMYDVFTRETIPGYTAKLNNSRNPIAHSLIVSGGGLNNIQRNETPIAHECIISWCVKTMQSVYSEGAYTEKVIKTITNNTLVPLQWETFQTYYADNAEMSGTDYFYNENITVVGDSGTAFHVDNGTHLLTASLFDDIFPSVYTLINSTDVGDAMLRYQQYITFGPVTRNLTYNPYMHDNITHHLNNLVTALTNLLRSSTDTIEMMVGPAYNQESFVDVRWPWLSLPLALLGFTFIFLVATVIRSSLESEHIGVWKTSAIAMLLYGLPDEMQKRLTSSKGGKTPRDQARNIKIVRDTSRGWRFSGTNPPPSPPPPPPASPPHPGPRHATI